MKTAWQEIHTIEQLDEIETQSKKVPVVLFKHSTRCGLSYSVRKGLEREWVQSGPGIVFYHLDLIKYRKISDEIADRWKVAHQSPQVIILYRGSVLYHGSHRAISAKRIEKELSQASG